jgi:hypothetical protein
MSSGTRLQTGARFALAAIRLANGTASLLAPATFARRLGIDPEQNQPALYVMRLFGIRTILIGSDLLRRDAAARERALRVGLLIHASDTTAAVLAGRSGQLPAKAANVATAISALNLVLALYARRRRRPG